MRPKLFILLFCISCFNSFAQNLFVADYATGGGATDLSLITYDRCFFSGFEVQNGKVTVMKTDSAGNVLWSNQLDYQITGYFDFIAIEQAVDSGFLLLLNITQPGMAHSDPTITRLDKSGNYLWTQHYISVLSAHAYSIIKNNDNGFMVTGSRQVNDFVMKCDSNGSITWIKQFNGGSAASNYDIATHDFNHFAITGRQGTNMVFFEIDLSGTLYWNSAISFANSGIGQLSMKPGSNGGYIVTGQLVYVAGNNFDSFLLRTDSVGTVQWLRVYSASTGTAAYDVVELADSSLLVVGFDQLNSFALKTDPGGNLLFSKTELLPFCYYGSVQSFTPGTVLIGGRRGSVLSFLALADTGCSSLCNITPLPIQEFQPTYANAASTFAPVNLPFTQGNLLVPYTPNPLVRNVLCGSTSAIELTAQDEIELYPNPATDNITVITTPGEVSEVILYNMVSGKLLQQQFTGSVSLNVANLSKGIYFYEVRNKHGVIKQSKFVKE